MYLDGEGVMSLIGPRYSPVTLQWIEERMALMWNRYGPHTAKLRLHHDDFDALMAGIQNPDRIWLSDTNDLRLETDYGSITIARDHSVRKGTPIYDTDIRGW